MSRNERICQIIEDLKRGQFAKYPARFLHALALRQYGEEVRNLIKD